MYLLNGQMVEVVSPVGNKFLVAEIYDCDLGGEPYNEPRADLEHPYLVSAVFETPPKHKYDEQIKMAMETVEELNKTIRTQKDELYSLKHQKTDLSRLIFNKGEWKNAKTIHYFPDGEIHPVEMSKESQENPKIMFEMSMFEGETRCWGYKLDKGYYSSYSNYIDGEYGLLIDKSEDELLAICHARQTKKGLSGQNRFNDYTLRGCNDKWLTPEFLKAKEIEVAKKRKTDIDEITNRIASEQAKLNALLEKESQQ